MDEGRSRLSIPVPDSALALRARELISDVAAPFLVNHSVRCHAWAVELARHDGLQFDAEKFGLPRERFLTALRAEGMAFDEGFRALHVGRSPSRFRGVGDLTEAERAHHGTLILHHPVLLEERVIVHEVAQAVQLVLAHADLAGLLAQLRPQFVEVVQAGQVACRHRRLSRRLKRTILRQLRHRVVDHGHIGHAAFGSAAIGGLLTHTGQIQADVGAGPAVRVRSVGSATLGVRSLSSGP